MLGEISLPENSLFWPLGSPVMKRVLAVSPHADDVELGCSGALSRWLTEGVEVKVVTVLVKPEKQAHVGGVVQARERVSEFTEAMMRLCKGRDGLHWQTLITSSDIEFDLCSFPKSKLVQSLDAQIADFKPDTLLMPVPSFHQEHQFVYEACVAASRTTRYPNPLKTVAAYEYPAVNWGPSADWSAAKGGWYVDISKHIATKMDVIAAHVSQCYRREQSLISLEAVKALARFRGIEAGTEYAELFHLLRRVS